MVQSEWDTLRLLESRGFEWAPRPLGRSLTFENPIGLPFLVLSWAPGSSMRWDDTHPPRPVRDRLLGQLAAIQLSLLECTISDSGTATWATFFGRLITNRRALVRNGAMSGLSEADCDAQEAHLGSILDNGGGEREMAMDHGDLKPENIIVDGEGNVTCIIDWGMAAQVPIPRAACLPHFLWGPLASTVARRDRDVYVTSFIARDSPAARYCTHFQTGRDLDFRTLYIDSLFSKGTHISLAARGWKVD